MIKIINKLHCVQKEIDYIQKKGENKAQGYNYLSEKQVTEEIKKLFDKYGISPLFNWDEPKVLPFTTAKGSNQFLTTVNIQYSLVDIESGEKIDGHISGHGVDSGDKGLYKAITGAIKYLYMKMFNIPSGNDPEAEDNEKVNETKKNDGVVNVKWNKPLEERMVTDED